MTDACFQVNLILAVLYFGIGSGTVTAIARSYHTATLLPSGKVLIAGGGLGGDDGDFGPFPIVYASEELYTPTLLVPAAARAMR